MQIYGMDDTLIEIYNIKDITSIKLWDRMLNSYNENKMIIVPGLIVTYNGGKMLNICADEKYFYEFVKKVREVYNDEKDNILEDSLTDPFRLRTNIDIDERTKKILESGELQNINPIYEYYDDKYSYDSSLLFQKNLVELLYPIVKYHIEEFYSKTDKTVFLSNEINGYRNKYSTESKVDGVDRNIIIEYEYVDDNKYIFYVSGIYNSTNSIKIEIEFKKDRIEISLVDKVNDIFASFIYLTTNENVKSVINIFKGHLSIYYENKDLESVENDLVNITDLDCKTNLKWFKLPWNAMYGIDNKVEKLNDSESLIKHHTMYVLTLENSFIKREKYNSSYLRKNTTAITSEEVVLDEVNKNTSCICISKNEGIYVIETSFLDVKDPNGYYDGKLRNRYFYHVVKSKNGVREISRDNMISLSNKDVLTNCDLVSKQKMLSLVGGCKYGR